MRSTHTGVFVMSKTKFFYPVNLHTESDKVEDGAVSPEIEFVIYGRLLDADLLTADVVEEIEQYTVFSTQMSGKALGQIRTRRTNGVLYELTTKVYVEGQAGADEYEESCSEELFDQFKRIANNGIIKTRYKYNIPFSHIPGLCYELDVMQSKTGRAAYAKVDIEIPKEFKTLQAQKDLFRLLPALPFRMTEKVVVFPGQRSAEASAKIKEMTSDWCVIK